MPLQLFEPRYLDMVSRCMREDKPFGVVLIRQGSDIWKPGTGGPDLFDIGTEARIIHCWPGLQGIEGSADPVEGDLGG